MKIMLTSYGACLLAFSLYCTAAAAALSASLASSSTPSGDYCHYETVRAACNEGDVILVRRAVYGRMKLGRCVKSDFGFVGCSVDVMDVIDRQCSGRRSCEFLVTDPTMDNRKPCNDEFKNYLELDYICVHTAGQGCDLDLGSGGVYVTKDATCGSPNQPWKVKVGQGQRINVTLYDFSLFPTLGGGGAGHVDMTSSHSVQQRPGAMKVCHRYGYIREAAATRGGEGRLTSSHYTSKDICGSHVSRVSFVYETVTSSADIVLADNEAFTFLLLVTAVGCVTPVFQSHVKWSRDGDVIEAQCQGRSTVYRLHCTDHRWTGYISNCTGTGSDQGMSASNHLSEGEFVFLAADLTVGIIIGVAIVISIVIISVGLVIIRRRRYQELRQTSSGQRQFPHHYRNSNSRTSTAGATYSTPSLLRNTLDHDPDLYPYGGVGGLLETTGCSGDRLLGNSQSTSSYCSPNNCYYMRVHSLPPDLHLDYGGYGGAAESTAGNYGNARCRLELQPCVDDVIANNSYDVTNNCAHKDKPAKSNTLVSLS